MKSQDKPLAAIDKKEFSLQVYLPLQKTIILYQRNISAAFGHKQERIVILEFESFSYPIESK